MHGDERASALEKKSISITRLKQKMGAAGNGVQITLKRKASRLRD